MTIVKNQKVKIKWNGKHKKYYESMRNENGEQKYFYKYNECFYIDLNDLPSGSQAEVEVICDYCNKSFFKRYINFLRERESNVIKKDCCRECSPIKLRERYGTLNELDYRQEENLKVENGYSKEYLINEFWRYYKEYEKYPKLTDLLSNNSYPSASGYCTHWGNWNNFLLDINIISNDGWYIDDEKVLIDLFPKDEVKLFDIENKLIDYRSITEIESKAIKLGLSRKSSLYNKRDYDKGETKQDRIDIATQAIEDLYLDLKRVPTIKDYERYAKENKVLQRRNLEINTSKSFSDICYELFNSKNKEVKTKDELISELTELRNKIGRTPMANELTKYGLSEKKAYMRKFNMSYQDLIINLGWELPTPKMNFKTKEELLNDYYKLYLKLGRIPFMDDIDNEGNMSSYRTYLKYFNTIFNVLDILEIDYTNEILNHSIGSGFTCIDKNGEICRSESEMHISNIFIDNGIIFKKEKMYSDIITNTLKTWKMDWYLPDYNIIVEYFGLFQETQLERNTRLGKYSRKVKQKIECCKEHNIIIIDLYRDDAKNNYEGVKYKLSKYLNINNLFIN